MRRRPRPDSVIQSAAKTNSDPLMEELKAKREQLEGRRSMLEGYL
jgi:hypothetical protein